MCELWPRLWPRVTLGMRLCDLLLLQVNASTENLQSLHVLMLFFFYYFHVCLAVCLCLLVYLFVCWMETAWCCFCPCLQPSLMFLHIVLYWYMAVCTLKFLFFKHNKVTCCFWSGVLSIPSYPNLSFLLAHALEMNLKVFLCFFYA